MKIRYEYKKKESLAAFADKYDLTMVVRERSDPALRRFFASFEFADVKVGGMLVGSYGDGETEDEAIAAYADKISDAVLIVGKPGTGRQTIRCPELEYINDKG